MQEQVGNIDRNLEIQRASIKNWYYLFFLISGTAFWGIVFYFITLQQKVGSWGHQTLPKR